MAGEVGTAAGDADAVAPLGQRPHDMAAYEARPAEDDDELWGLQDFGHGWLRRFPDAMGLG